MHKRLYDHLAALARRHAPHLLTQQPFEQQIKPLANGLAREGILVLTGQPNGQEQSEIVANINAWVALYIRMYEILAEQLFPRHTQVHADYMDHQLPPVIMIQGQADHVIRMLAGYIIPYVTVRQENQLVSEAELDGVMRQILEDLEASDLKPEVYNRVKRMGVAVLDDMLKASVRQYTLTDFIKPMFKNAPQFELPRFDPPKPDVPPPPPNLPKTPPERPETSVNAAPAPTPLNLPETPPEMPKKMDTQVMFASKIPIFFKKPTAEDKGPKTRGPLPPPDKKPK